MVLLGILLYSLFFFTKAEPIPEIANYKPQGGTAEKEVSSTLPSISNDEYEKRIDLLMKTIIKQHEEIQDLIRAEDERKKSQIRLKQDISYVKLRQNVSLGVLEAIIEDHKNDSRAITLITRKKAALKTNIPCFENVPFADFSLVSLMLAYQPMIVNSAKSGLWQFHDKIDSDAIRERIEKEVEYLENLDFKQPKQSEYVKPVNHKKVTDALQLSKASDGKRIKLRLGMQEHAMLEEMKEFTLQYKEKLEKQIEQLHSKEDELPSSRNHVPESLEHNRSAQALAELLEKYAEDSSAYVMINEKLQKLKNNRDFMKLSEEERMLLELPFKDDYRNNVENEIKEHLKKFSSEENVMGIEKNGSLTYYNREEKTAELSTNSTIEDRIWLQSQLFEKLQTDVVEWNQTLFREYENLLRKKDNQTLQNIRFVVKMNVISKFAREKWPASNWIDEEFSKLYKEDRENDGAFETINSYLNSRYKVDPFIFMRRLERIENELKQLMKLSDDANLKETIKDALGTIEKIDYMESSLKDKKQFDAKIVEATFKVEQSKVKYAFKQLLYNQKNEEKRKQMGKDLSLREALILKKMEQLGQKYTQELQEKNDKAAAEGNEPEDPSFCAGPYRKPMSNM